MVTESQPGVKMFEPFNTLNTLGLKPNKQQSTIDDMNVLELSLFE